MAENTRPKLPILREVLELGTNIAVLLAAVVVLCAIAWTYFGGKQKPIINKGLQKGQEMARLPGHEYSARKTLIVAMTTNSGSCRASIPFYKRLLDIAHENGGEPEIVAVFPDSKEVVDRYVQDSELNGLEAIAAIDIGELKINSTPSLILVDRSGRVLDFWVGSLNEQSQSTVIQELKS